MLERAKTLPNRGLYFDLVSFVQATTKHQPTNTPAISLLYALETQLGRIEREGGVEARWRRHDAMRSRVEAWSEERGVPYVPREGRRSWTVSCLKLPDGTASKTVVSALKEAGRARHGAAAGLGAAHPLGGRGDAARGMGPQAVRRHRAPGQDDRRRGDGTHRRSRRPARPGVRHAGRRTRSVPRPRARG